MILTSFRGLKIFIIKKANNTIVGFFCLFYYTVRNAVDCGMILKVYFVHMKKTFLSIFAVISMQLFAQTNDQVTKVINGKTYLQHTVVQGETFYGLSKTFASSVDEIKNVNGGLTTLKIGQTLWVPQSASAKPTVASASPAKTHVVAEGETLYAISKKYNVSAEDIKKWNGLSDNAISIGQELAVSAGSKGIKLTETPNVSNAEVKPIATSSATTKPSTPAKTTAPVTNNNTSSATAQASTPPSTASTTSADVSETTVKAATTVTVKRQDETSETMMAALSSSESMTADRCYVKHPTIPVGNIIVVINPANGKMAYCRVVENNTNASNLEMTQAVADKLELSETKTQVTIKYATL